MGRFSAAKMIGAIDVKFQNLYNQLIDLLDTGYIVELAIDKKRIRIELTPSKGLAFYQDGVYRGGIELVNGVLTLATDILKSATDNGAYMQFTTEVIGGITYGVTNWKVWNDSDHTQYFTNLRLYSGADATSTFTGMESNRDGTTSINISANQETSAESQPAFILLTSVDDADGDPSINITVENKAGNVMSIDVLPTDIDIRNESGTLLKIFKTGEINAPNISIRANNAAALAAGLSVGSLYRTGADPDVLCIVH